jgi:chromate transporter
MSAAATAQTGTGSVVSSSIAEAARPAKPLSLWNLSSGFLLIGMLGFGGIAQSAQYVMVERRRWLTPKEFVELFGICAILPGGNILNASVMLGDKNHGPIGSIVCLSSLLFAPLALLLMVALAYDTFSYLPDVRAATAGGASVAAGLIFGTAARLAKGVTPSVAAVAAGLGTFIMVGVFKLPIWAVIVTIAPLATLWSMYGGRRA